MCFPYFSGDEGELEQIERCLKKLQNLMLRQSRRSHGICRRSGEETMAIESLVFLNIAILLNTVFKSFFGISNNIRSCKPFYFVTD
jgi:hypothetical protein